MSRRTVGRRKKRNKALIIAICSLAIVGAICYALADRYLIDHVEVLPGTSVTEDADLPSATEQTGTANASDSDGTATTDSPSIESGGVATWDVDSYSSDNIQIDISTVVTGTGSDTVTYYVADVTVSDVSYLLSAFAEGTFGRNIIEYTSAIANANDAILAINGDYFGFRDNGIEIRNGVLYRDVGARVGAAIYGDGSMRFYDETATTGEALLSDGVVHTLSFGPILVQDSVAVTIFDNVRIDDNVGNASSITSANPRTGIGMIAANHYVFIVVDGRSKGYSRGVTLTEFAQIFADLGCVNAYNLDGGGSSAMIFMGDLVNNPLGKYKERGTSDILYIGES